MEEGGREEGGGREGGGKYLKRRNDYSSCPV